MTDDPKGATLGHDVISMPTRAAPADMDVATPPQAPVLTADQRLALGHLAVKQAGGLAPWINIAAARALTDAGLAERSREGWNITAAGLAEVEAEKHRPAT
jgi:hypothetical protein